MTQLTPNDAALLATMIGTVGTIWGIGFVAFAFLFDRWQEFLRNLYPGAEVPASPRLFSLFFWATVFSFSSIVISLVVFTANSHEWLIVAVLGFLMSAGSFLWLTTAVYRAARREVLS